MTFAVDWALSNNYLSIYHLTLITLTITVTCFDLPSFNVFIQDHHYSICLCIIVVVVVGGGLAYRRIHISGTDSDSYI